MTDSIDPAELAQERNREFIAKVKSRGFVIQDRKELVWFSFIRLSDIIPFNGVFDVVEELYRHGWTFGEGELKFNRSLDIFYLSIIASGIYRMAQWGVDDYTDILDYNFDVFWTRYHNMVGPEAWKDYYTPTFLHQPTSARYYRLPNLRDILDSSDPVMAPRPHRGVGHFTKLYRWAYCVTRTARTQLSLPQNLSPDTLVDIALSTLQDTISKQQDEDPHEPSFVTPFSATQARYWLKSVGVYPTNNSRPTKWTWYFYQPGQRIANGAEDVWRWEADYSPKAWHESVSTPFLVVEPDRDGTREPEVTFYGWPDGGTGSSGAIRGWDPEVGSQEEVEFMAAVAAKETEDVGMEQLNYELRSHLLLGVLHAAFCESAGAERAEKIQNLTQNLLATERITEEGMAKEWVQQALKVVEGCRCVQEGKWPPTPKERSEMLRRILVENGQLFGRWQIFSKEFDFKLDGSKGALAAP